MTLSLSFQNRFTNTLPADPETENHPRPVSGALFSRVQPVAFEKPVYVAHSPEVAHLLGLTEADVKSQDFLEAFSGKSLLPGMDPHAQRYGGHQFGNWAGQLGDGRAIVLGEVKTASGHLTLQLKGAGPTPYSRRGDGFAVLRSSIREFLCSEAMHHLGVPTTRALSLMLTGEQVMRDMFYTGNIQDEPGAVVCRVAPSFTRFGHFEILAAREETELLQQLLDYTLRHDDIEWLRTQGVDPAQPEPLDPSLYGAWFKTVCERTAHMILHWMRVGFVHGVMNTDNMSVLGLTIDYGPYGWLEDFDPIWTPNTTDAQGKRYAYGKQPPIAQWNLMKFAQSLFDIVDEEDLRLGLNHYAITYEQGWQAMMAQKLGFSEHVDTAEAEKIYDDLIALLQRTETDMTLFYRGLAHLQTEREYKALPECLMTAYYETPDDATVAATLQWIQAYQKVLKAQPVADTERAKSMNAVNPKYVLRNYMAQEAIESAEKGDYQRIHTLLEVLRHPYDEQPEHEEFAKKRPEWARHKPGCSMLSCSS